MKVLKAILFLIVTGLLLPCVAGAKSDKDANILFSKSPNKYVVKSKTVTKKDSYDRSFAIKTPRAFPIYYDRNEINLQESSDNYRNAPLERTNNTNHTKIKNSVQYKLPYDGYGKSHKDICLIKYCDDLLMPPYYKKFFMRNDSIFVYNIYSKYNYTNHSYEDIIDSVKLLDWSFIKVGKNKYIESYIDMGGSVQKLIKFRKKAKTKWLKKNNKWFNADYELIPSFKYNLRQAKVYTIGR